MTSQRGNPAPPESVVGVFDRIAPVYDLMNTVMTAGIDRRWRSAAVRAARLGPGMRVLDVACGTGALTRQLAAEVGSGGEVIGVDRSEPMLTRARVAAEARAAARRTAARRTAAPIVYRAADALALPFPDASFDAVTIAFGLRNLSNYATALAEMSRLARAGARVVVLEIAEPRTGIGRTLFHTWFRRVVPVLGRVAGSASAYRYLPASLETYPDPEGIARLMEEAGLREVRWRWLTTGMATLHVAIAAPRGEAGA